MICAKTPKRGEYNDLVFILPVVGDSLLRILVDDLHTFGRLYRDDRQT